MKILVAYGTLTFNTEIISEHIVEVLKTKKFDVDLKNINNIENPKDFEPYNYIIFGTSTWSDGEYNPDTIEFFEAMDKFSKDDLKKILSTKKFAYFGLGEKHYEFYCKSAYDAKEYFEKLGTKSIGEVLEIDGYPEEEQLEQAKDWIDKLTNSLSSQERAG